MRLPAVVCPLAFVAGILLAQAIEPGTGAPNEYLRNLFAKAWSRGSFSRVAALPPAGPVRRFGDAGLIQEFNDSTRSSGRLALVKANAVADPENPSGDVYQILTDVYAYYGTVGVSTAGYPLADTQTCPAIACTWQFFNRRYALFVYSAGTGETDNITVRDPFYTRWEFLGGITRMGPPVTGETTTTSYFGSTATVQQFTDGVLFNITSGTLNGRLVGVRQPVYGLYRQRGGQTGSLGYPTGDEQVLPNGRRRQSFEGGSIEYDDSTGPIVRPPVSSVVVRPATTPVRLGAGDSITLEASVLGNDGTQLTDRQINWITTNSLVASVQASGAAALVRAAGGGTARVTATSEGKSSAPIEIIVTAQCCLVGEGAPSAAIRQAFLDVVARSRIQVRLPGPERVRRSGFGYVQELQGSDTAATRYVLAISDRSAQAYVISGPVLSRYEEIGGPPSFLGFPAADATLSARQLFEGGALAGTPVRLVSGAILARWAASGYESGPAGLPVAEAFQATSFTGSSGHVQRFANAILTGGSRGAFIVLAPVAQHYAGLEGALGVLGFPTSDETAAAGTRRQEFEGGTLEYAEGSAEVHATTRERKPSVSVLPAAVLPGSRVRVTLAGFPDGATLRVSSTGQPDFVAIAPTGSFSWEFLVPAGAAAGTVRIRAVDGSGTSVEASYAIRTVAEARVQLIKVAGDTQSGAPGVLLPNPLRVALRDEAGNPVSGAAVRFTASPGAAAMPQTAVTDDSGIAETILRLPSGDGIALLTAEAARQVVTFSARAVGASITSFPQLIQTGTETVGNGSATVAEAGALLASAASIVRYYQARGDLGSPNGLATVTALNDFLRRSCTSDTAGVQVCDGFITGPTGASIVNLARIGQFTNGGLEVSVERPDPSNVASLVAAGYPVLLALTMTSGGRTGSHFVVAQGTTADGGLSIHDPDPPFSRTKLADYLNGFDAAGSSWQATVSGALRLMPKRASGSAFFVHTAAAGLRLASSSGECGYDFVMPDQPARASRSTTAANGMLRFRTCDGSAAEYQLELDGDGALRASVIDMTGGGRTELAGGGGSAFRISRAAGGLSAATQTAAIAPASIVNSASFTADIAAGGMISIFGSGLSRTGRETTVTIGGRTAAVIAALPFQINAQVPFDTPPGSHVLRINAPWGPAEQPFDVRAVAPAVFRAGARAMVVNQDGTLNTSSSPARRGESVVIYATGLGTVSGTGVLRPANIPVTALLRSQEIRVDYAGLTPGFLGLYQINVLIPVTVAPGIEILLTLRQGTAEARPVEISIF